MSLRAVLEDCNSNVPGDCDLESDSRRGASVQRPFRSKPSKSMKVFLGLVMTGLAVFIAAVGVAPTVLYFTRPAAERFNRALLLVRRAVSRFHRV